VFDALGCPALVLAGAPTAVIVHANPAFAELTGRPVRDVLGSDVFALAGSGCEPFVQRRLSEAIARKQPFSAEWAVRTAHGESIPCRIELRPIDAAHCVMTLEDLTPMLRMRASVRATQARLDVAMEASALSMWDWDVERDEVYYNDQWRSSLGVDPHELLLLESRLERLMLPSDDPGAVESFERHLRGATPYFEAEYQLPTRSGERKWFLAHARVVRRSESGQALRVIGVLRDVSLSKLHQEERLEVENRWRRAVRGTSDGLYDWDLLSGYVWYAERFREIVGYGPKEFPDTFQAFQQVLHPEDRALVMGKIRAHLENRARLDLRCRIVAGGGATLWCRLRGEAERDASGRPLRLSGSLSDITAQIEAEEAFNRSQDFYGTILDELPLYVAYADSEQRIVYANRMFQDFFALPLDVGRGRSIEELIGAERYGAVASLIREALAGRAIEGHGRVKDACGRDLDLDAVFLPHQDETGRVQGCFIAARDVTEKRQLEAELRQSQKMEAIGRLTGGIAHDFNNLLSVIVGNMQLLARSPQSSARTARYVDTALNAAIRGAELTRRLLAFARQQVLEPKIVDLNEALDGMYELLRRALTNDVEIGRRLAPDAWPAKLDPGQLENAVLNLVINARDAMPKGGRITLATRNAVLGSSPALRARMLPHEQAAPPGEYVVLEISDTGAGMPPEVLKRAFEPFFTTKDVGKGSGLGLSMVYGFMRQSGGFAHITSVLDQGSTVHLYFPRNLTKAQQPDAEPAADAAELPHGDEVLLVVEDNVAVRMTAVEILRTLGYRVLEASNGRQALERFAQHPDIALVFSDVMLPGGLLGPQLIAKLRAVRPDLKVLMTSGFSESTVLHRGVLDGSVALLPKPYRVEDLARRIREQLDV
jgi:PAS domain S-box-containing protein